jgi:hypothetical protein
MAAKVVSPEMHKDRELRALVAKVPYRIRVPKVPLAQMGKWCNCLRQLWAAQGPTSCHTEWAEMALQDNQVVMPQDMAVAALEGVPVLPYKFLVWRPTDLEAATGHPGQ